MKIIIYFLPAILSTKKDIKEKDNTFEIISIYAKYCLLINLSMLLLLAIAGRLNEALTPTDSIKFYIMYIIGSLFLSWFIPIVLKLFKKNFSIKIKGKNNE